MTNIAETPIFNSIILFETQAKNRKDNLITVKPENYNEVLKTLKIPNEYISTNQVKPYFDVEIYYEKIITFQETSVVMKILQDIQNVLDLENSKNIYIIKDHPEK